MTLSFRVTTFFSVRLVNLTSPSKYNGDILEPKSDGSVRFGKD